MEPQNTHYSKSNCETKEKNMKASHYLFSRCITKLQYSKHCGTGMGTQNIVVEQKVRHKGTLMQSTNSLLIFNLPYKIVLVSAVCTTEICQFCSVASNSGNSRSVACQIDLSFIISQSLLKLMSFELVMSSNHLVLCCHLLLRSSLFPSIRVFSSSL